MSETLDGELADLAAETSRESATFLVTLSELAAGGKPDTALPLLLLACTQLQSCHFLVT